MRNEFVVGTPDAYKFLAAVFGDMFRCAHSLKAFSTRAERSIPPFSGGDVPYAYKAGENSRSRKLYHKQALVDWFVAGITDENMLKRAQAAAANVYSTS